MAPSSPGHSSWRRRFAPTPREMATAGFQTVRAEAERELDPVKVVDAAFVAREVGDLPTSAALEAVHARVRRMRGDALFADMVRALVPIDALNEEEAIFFWRSFLAHRKRMSNLLGRPVPLSVAALDWLLAEGRMKQPVVAEHTSVQALLRNSTHDPLTGVLNRGAFEMLLERELEHGRRYAQPLSLLLLDLDHFKELNDGQGHAAGDAVLRQVGALLLDEMRRVDWCARYGGDEFAVIAAHTDEHHAVRLSQRIVARVRRELRGVITLSVGVAAETGGRLGAAELVAEADRALYASKRDGRDRVTAASHLTTLTRPVVS
jgi:diguanylate cyclase (GGDEF)-like protein